jgi:hypothetical protein
MDDYTPLLHAPAYLALGPQEYTLWISFLTGLRSSNIKHESELTRFQMVSMQELQTVLLVSNQRWLSYYDKHVYRYTPLSSAEHEGKMCFVQFPHWSSRYGVNQQGVLSFITFSRQDLKNPKFHPFSSVYHTALRNTLSLDQSGFDEFVYLLHQYTYEKFLNKEEQLS